MTLLATLDADSIGNILAYLPFEDVCHLELAGSHILNAKLYASNRSIILSLSGNPLPKWPRLLSRYTHLTNLSVSTSRLVQYWPIEGVDLTILPKTLKSLHLGAYDPLAAFVYGSSASSAYKSDGRFDFANRLPLLTTLRLDMHDTKNLLRFSHFPTTLTSLALNSSKYFAATLVLPLLPASLRDLSLEKVSLATETASILETLPEALESLKMVVECDDLAWLKLLPRNLTNLNINAIGEQLNMNEHFADLPRTLTALTFSGDSGELDVGSLRDLPTSLTSFSWDGWLYDALDFSQELLDAMPASLTRIYCGDYLASPELLTVENMPFWSKLTALDVPLNSELSCALPASIVDLKFRHGLLQLHSIPYLPLGNLKLLELAEVNDDLAKALFPSLTTLTCLVLRKGKLSKDGVAAIPRHSHLNWLTVNTGLFASLEAISALPPLLDSLTIASWDESIQHEDEYYLRSPLAVKLLPKRLQRIYTASEEWITPEWATALLKHQQELAKEIEVAGNDNSTCPKTIVYLAFPKAVVLPQELLSKLPKTLQTFSCTVKITDPIEAFKGLPQNLRALTLFVRPDRTSLSSVVKDEHIAYLPRDLYSLSLGREVNAVTEGANELLPPNLYKLDIGILDALWFDNDPKFEQLSLPFSE